MPGLRGAPDRRRWSALVLAGCLGAFPLAAQGLPAAPPPRASVAFLGVFHFRDAGLDDYKPRFAVDFRAPERQHEVDDLLRRLEGFRPTRVAVEWSATDQAALDERYASFRAGRPPDINERELLGFRLAAALGHERVYAIDAPARWYDTTVSGAKIQAQARANGQQALMQRNQAWDAYFGARQVLGDSAKTTMPLIETLRRINTAEARRRTLSQYLVGSIEVGAPPDYIGADTRTAWYNRNLRIFSNIMRLPQRPDERILVIIGAGHVPILYHLAENAPEFSLVDVLTVLR